MAWKDLAIMENKKAVKLFRIFIWAFVALGACYFSVYFILGFKYIGSAPEIQAAAKFANRYLTDVLEATQFGAKSEEFQKRQREIERKYAYDDWTGVGYNTTTMKMLAFQITHVNVEEVHFWEIQSWNQRKGKMEGEGEITGTMADVYFKTKIFLPSGWHPFKRHHYLAAIMSPVIPYGNKTYGINLFKLTLYKPQGTLRWYVYRPFEFRKGTVIERLE